MLLLASPYLQKNNTPKTTMQFWPSTISIRRPASVYILMLLIIFLGFTAYRTLPREAAPDIQIPLLIVSIPYPGSSPEDVEALITHKMETEMQNLENLKKISSLSAEGAAIVTLEFNLGVDIDAARTKVREALDKITPTLPEDTEDPLIKEINLSERPIMILNMAGELGLYRLKEIAEDIKERIEGIQGVLSVTRAGGLEREVQVNVDPDKLRYFNLDLNEVSNAIALENKTVPAGDMSVGPMKYMIRIPGEIKSPDEIRRMVITAPDQVSIFTQDVAEVKFGFQEITSLSRLYGLDSISLSISKRSGENLIKIADQVKQIIEEEKERYGGKLKFTILSDESTEIRKMVSDLENNIYMGLLFVLVVLLIAMGIRNALFIAAAIPFSMLLSFMVIEWAGITLNFVVLFSLILALGMLVDNAIVVVENIYRHLESGLTPREAAITGVGEVAIPVITSTITTLAAFLPLLFMPDIMGEFMRYLPLTLIITLTASLFVGLIINPVLCSTLMRQFKRPQKKDEIQLAESSRFLRVYRRVINWSIHHRLVVILLSLVVWGASIGGYFIFAFPNAGVEFFPQAEPPEVVINMEAPSGSTLDYSNGIIQKIEQKLENHQDITDAIVANVGQGRGNGSSNSSSSHLGHIVMSFPGWEDRQVKPSQVMSEVRELISGLTGAKLTVTKPQSGPPTGKAVSLEVSGKNLRQLKAISLEIQNKIKDIKGLVNLGDDLAANRSEFRVDIDREKAARLGLRTSQIAGIIRTAFNGRTVSTYRVGKDEFDIIVRLDRNYRKSITDLESLYVKTPTGESISLKELATVRSTAALGSIRHVGSKRVITIGADTEGVPGPVVLKRVQERLADYKLPQGFSLRYSGENESQQKMQAYLGKSFVVAIFLIFLVLVTQFNSLMMPFIILSSVFLSLAGVFIGMTIHQSPISIMMGGIGVISLAGVVVNNAIVLIDYIQQLRAKGMAKNEAIVLAGMLRMRPVLLTAITTILGLMPITMGMDINFYRSQIIKFGSEGGATWVPMAQAVIYGLGVATVLTLIVVPTIYSVMDSSKEGIIRLFRKLRGKQPLSAENSLNQLPN